MIKPKKDDGKKVKHVCKKEDVETAKAVLKDTRPCPSCATRIFKIEGCNQMFCTKCHTAFDWQTGVIVTRNIHNPHYIELQARLGRDAMRAAGDVPCGGLDGEPRIFSQRRHPHVLCAQYLRRRVGEANDIIFTATEVPIDFSGLRVAYLMGTLDEARFAKRIFLYERMREKREILLAIFETFRTAMIERLNTLYAVVDGIRIDCATARNAFRKFFIEAFRIVRLCNDSFVEAYGLIGFKACPYIPVCRHIRERCNERDRLRFQASDRRELVHRLGIRDV